MNNKSYLLTDEEVVNFIIYGYHFVEIDFPPGFNETIYKELEQLGITRSNDLANAILERVPKLQQVYNHPKVSGAMTSLLGKDFIMYEDSYCHKNVPGTRSQYWHQDGPNQRHHQIRDVFSLYYPQDVTPDMGPTALIPGTHFRNAPTERVVTYGTFKDQVLTTVKAGTVVIVHFDIWHAATANTSNKTRYMLKCPFGRVSEPKNPSWNHDPEKAQVALQHLTEANSIECSQSDTYKEAALRWDMLNHLMGNSLTKESYLQQKIRISKSERASQKSS